MPHFGESYDPAFYQRREAARRLKLRQRYPNLDKFEIDRILAKKRYR